MIDKRQTEMLLTPGQGLVQLYTRNLKKEQLKQIYVPDVASLEEAVIANIKKQENHDIDVFPKGPCVIPHNRSI